MGSQPKQQMSSYSTYIDDYIQISEDIIRHLECQLSRLQSHYKLCKLVKTASTSISTLGLLLTISALVLAPITGGSLIVVATGVGTMLTLSGVVANIVTDIFDYSVSKLYETKATRTFGERQQAERKLRAYQTRFKVASQDFGLSFEQGKQVIVSNAKTVALNINVAYEVGRCATLASSMSSFSLRTGGKVWKSMKEMSTNLSSLFTMLGVDVGPKTSLALVRHGVIVSNSVFVVLDVYYLARSWTNPQHTPAMHTILAFIRHIETDLGFFK